MSALIRRCHATGSTAVVMRRGATEAGAIFVLVDRLDGTGDLYAPAPQAMLEGDPGERRFQQVAERVPTAELDERLEREGSFDPDIWVVVIDDRDGRPFVEIV